MYGRDGTTNVFWYSPRNTDTEGAEYVIYTIGPPGFGATAWKVVARKLMPDVELRALRPPGRESRMREAPLSSVADQALDLTRGMLPVLAQDGRPFSVVGLCTGALIAYETARILERDGARSPEALVVINQEAPRFHCPLLGEPHRLPGDEFRDWLLEHAHVPGELLTPEVFAVFEPMFRADLEAVETYEVGMGEPLRSDLVALHGGDAVGMSRDGVIAWEETTTGSFREHRAALDHNPLLQDPGLLARTLSALFAPEGGTVGQEPIGRE